MRIAPPYKIDIVSVYYGHPGEGPNSVNVTQKLDGPNYLACQKFMKHALGAKNKLKFINGSIQIPLEDDPNLAQWEICNHLVHSWIPDSVSDQIASTIVFHDNAVNVCDDLRERLSKAGRIRVATLTSSINSLKQNKKYVLDYFHLKFQLIHPFLLLQEIMHPFHKLSMISFSHYYNSQI